MFFGPEREHSVVQAERCSCEGNDIGDTFVSTCGKGSTFRATGAIWENTKPFSEYLANTKSMAG